MGTKVRILLEVNEKLYNITAYDDVGQVARVESFDKDKGIEKIKRLTERRLGEDCEFIVESYQ